MKLTLAITFLVTAALYASVGFGGGSTYTALLAVTDTPYYIVPIVSLICNICVVSGNSWRYARKRIVKFVNTWPLLILSIPGAFIGGILNVSEEIFIGLLSLTLFFAGIRMVLSCASKDLPNVKGLKDKTLLSAMVGGCIGFQSGIVGIGGGIFLAPILYRLRWGTAQEIAGVCSVFILMNSISGLIGQVSKIPDLSHSIIILPYWPLVLAVLIGGTLGNVVSFRFLKQIHLRRITGVLILVVAVRLFMKWMALVGSV